MNNINNKSANRSIGELGEQLTCDYLESKGYCIFQRNFHSRYGELDIIATNPKYIAFVEVKTRKFNTAIQPCLSVNKSKRDKIMRTAYLFLKKYELKLQPRFDVCEVYLINNHLHHINYIENAFIQEGDYANF